MSNAYNNIVSAEESESLIDADWQRKRATAPELTNSILSRPFGSADVLRGINGSRDSETDKGILSYLSCVIWRTDTNRGMICHDCAIECRW